MWTKAIFLENNLVVCFKSLKTSTHFDMVIPLRGLHPIEIIGFLPVEKIIYGKKKKETVSKRTKTFIVAISE